MGDMDWGDTERGGHLKKFFIKMLVFLLVIAIAVVAVIFLRPKKEYYNVGVTGETYCIPHLTGEGKYESGKTITISADDIPGYAFRNWTLNGEVVSTDAEYTFVVKKETSGTYIANYEAIDYSVRMLGIYGTFSVTPTANVGDLIEIKDITPNEGYEAGRAYYTLDTNTEEITIVNNKFYMPAGDVRVIVEFNPITYTIEYELDEGEFEEGTTVVSTYNIKTTSFTLPKPTKFGYDFIGWTGPNLNYPTETVTIRRGSTGNRKYTANYEYHTYSITNVNGQNGTITVDSSAKYKSTVGVSVTANGGFGLSELYYILEGTDTKVPIIDNAFEMPAGNVTIYSTFSKIGYTIKLANITHGSVDIDKTSAYLGESVGIRVQADTAYRFSRSYYVVDGSVEQREFSGSFYMPGGNVTVVVEFTPEIYSLKLNLNGGKLNGVSYDGIYEYMTYTVESNRIVLPTPDEREDYEFLGWSGTDILPEGSYVLSYVIPRGSWGERTYSANWKIKTYKITFNNYDGSELLVLPAVEHGTIPQYVGTPTKPSTEEYDYIFNGWSPSLVAATKEATYTATFTQKLHEYTITFDSCGGESVNPYIRHYNDNIGTMPTPTRRGYNLEGWFTRAEGGAQMIASDKVTADATYYAHWSLVEYTVEIDLAGGSFSGQTSFTYNVTSEDIAIQRPSKTGYTFTGFTGTELSEKTLDVTIAQGSVGNRVYLATYEAIKYTIKWLNYDGSTLLEEQVAYDTMPEYSGEKPTKPRDTEYSYVFNNVWQPAITKVTGNASYTAQFEAVTNGYTISFDSRGGSDVHEITKDYNKEIGTLPVPIFDGYTFDGWYTEVTGGDKLTETTKVTEDKTYYAHWSVITYTISYSLDGGTGTGVTSYTVETETFTLFTPTKTGYAFVGWTGTDLTSATVDVVIEKGSIGNRSYTANWSQSAFNISKGTVTNGTIDAPANAFMGATVTITATPAEGYEVSNYYYIAAGSTEKVTATNGSFTMPASDVTVYAEFVKATFTITIADTTNGLVKSSKTSATMGEEITLTITADNGYFANSVSYRLAGSTQDITITNSKFTMPASNITVYVVFGFRNYTITKGTIANGTLTVPDTAKYKDTVTVTATPATGYELTALYYYLEGDNTTKITVTDNKFTMPASNITIYAEFTAMTKVTVDIDGTIRSFPCAKGAKLEDILPEDLNEHNTSGYYTEDESGDRTYYDASYVVTGDITLKTHLATLDKLTFTADNASSPTSYSVKGSDNTATSIAIPKLYNNLPVKEIMNNSFESYSKLSNVQIPNSVINIKSQAFRYNFNLKEIYLPESLILLGDECFANIYTSSIFIPKNVETIGKNPFCYNQNLESIKISSENINFKAINNCLVTTDGKTLIFGCKNSIIPSSVTLIKESAFAGCGLATITLPSELKEIKEYAFSNTLLTTITIPKNVSKIGEYDISGVVPRNVFDGCKQLTSITVEDGNTSFKVVNNCLLTYDGKELVAGIKNSIIPDGVEIIRRAAFDGIPIEKVVIPTSVKIIRSEAFERCEQLSELVLQEGVEELYFSVINQVPMLKELYFPSTITKFEIALSMRYISFDRIYFNNSYCYKNARGNDYSFMGQAARVTTQVYVLASVDDGSNTYLSDTTKFPYTYTNIYYNGNAYNLYAKEELGQKVTMLVNNTERTFFGAKGQALSAFLPEELNEHNTCGYYSEDENGDRTYYDASYIVNSDLSLKTYKATISSLTFTPDNSDSPTYYKASAIDAQKTSGVVIIPKLYNNLPVKVLGTFTYCNVTKIEMPYTIEIIDGGFYLYNASGTGMASLYISANVKEINEKYHTSVVEGHYTLDSIKVDSKNTRYTDNDSNYIIDKTTNAFIQGCKANVTIPNTIKEIYAFAFAGMLKKTNSNYSITIPASVETIGNNPFSRNSDITALSVESGNTKFKSVNNCILSADGTTLIAGCKNSVIPNTVETIAKYSFTDMDIEELIIPTSVKTIEWEAFATNNKFQFAELHEGLIKIDYGAFGLTKGHESVFLPASLVDIGYGAFSFAYGSSAVETIGVESLYINNSYQLGDFTVIKYFGQSVHNTLKYVYVLASVDDGSNTYLSDETKYPYKYENVTYNGKTYNLYSKEEFNQRITMYVDDEERTFLGTKGQALSTFLPEELSEFNTSGYYAEDADGERTYYESNYIVTGDMTLKTHKATLDLLKFTANSTTNPTYYLVIEKSTSSRDFTSITIPKLYNGLPVKVVGNMPMSSNLTSFEMPNTIEIFDPKFAYFKGETIYLHEGLKELGVISGIYSSQEITHITIPSTLQKIGVNAYNGSIAYFSSRPNPFSKFYRLNTISIRGENNYFSVVNNCLLSKDGKTLISGSTQAIIPDTVTTIGESAFKNISPLTKITLPATLERIEESAFESSDLGGVKEIVFPSTLKYIGENAFYGPTNFLSKITLNDNLESLGPEAFAWKKITEINIPAKCELAKYLGEYSNPFAHCSKLEKITVDSANTKYKVVDNCLLTADGKNLIIGCKNSIIPSTVEAICYGSFAGVSIDNFIMPNSVKTINSSACTFIMTNSMYLSSSLTSISDYTFNFFTDMYNIKTIYINNTYAYTNSNGKDNGGLGGLSKRATIVYVLGSADDGSNTYLTNTTNYPYKYTGVTYNGKTYKVYSKENIEVAVTLTVDGTEHTYSGIKNATLVSAIPTEYNEHNTSGYYIEDDNEDRTYYDGDYVLTASISLTTHKATLDKFTFTVDDESNPTCYRVKLNGGKHTGSVVIPKLYNNLPVKIINRPGYSTPQTKYDKIEFPNTIIEIESESFPQHKAKSIYIGENVTKIGPSPFAGQALEKIKVDSKNTSYKDYNGLCLLNYSGTQLLMGTKKLTEIPSGVDTIESYAFEYMTDLVSIKITEGVEVIGGGAFEQTGLTQIELPKSLNSLRGNPFGDCSNLEIIKVASGNTSYKSVNDNCIISYDGTRFILGTNEATIPDTVTVLCRYAFGINTSYFIPTLPNGLKAIEINAFYRIKNSILNDLNLILPEGFETGAELAAQNVKVKNLYLPSTAISLGHAFVYSAETIYINNKYCYDNVLTDSSNILRDKTPTTKVYVLASVDDGSNTYLSNTTNYPYKYTGMTYNGKTYNVYSKEQAYSVTHSRSDGKVAVNGLQSKYFSGDTVKFSFSFGDYYELSSYTISGGVTATKSGTNYTFTMPSKNCTISATAKRKSGLTNIYFISIKIMNGYTYDQVMRAGGTTEFGYEYDANDKGHSTGFFLKAPYKLNKVEVYNGSTQTYSFEGPDQVKAFANDTYAFWVDVNWKTLNYDPIYYLYITT